MWCRSVLAIALCAALVPAGARAQPVLELIEACNPIPDAARRLQCLRNAVAQAQQAEGADAAIENGFRALQWQIQAGVGPEDYAQAVGRLERQLARYAAEAPSLKKAGTARLQQALAAYKDADLFWRTANQFYARRENAVAYFGGVPMDQVGLGWMVQKYRLPTRSADLLGLYTGVPAERGRAAIWAQAQQMVSEGLGLLRDPPWTAADYDTLRGAATDAVRRHLAARYPDATFQNLFAGRAPGSTERVLCGEVRGLRPDGAEVPLGRFFHQAGETMIEADEGPARDFPGEWSRRCGARLHEFR